MSEQTMTPLPSVNYHFECSNCNARWASARRADNCCDEGRFVDHRDRQSWDQYFKTSHRWDCIRYLEEQDEILCVQAEALKSGASEFWVHTNYATMDVVSDVVEHYDLDVRYFSPIEPGPGQFDCVDDHGPCFEINIEAIDCRWCPPSDEPLGEMYSAYDYIDESSKLFDAELPDGYHDPDLPGESSSFVPLDEVFDEVIEE